MTLMKQRRAWPHEADKVLQKMVDKGWMLIGQSGGGSGVIDYTFTKYESAEDREEREAKRKAKKARRKAKETPCPECAPHVRDVHDVHGCTARNCPCDRIDQVVV